MTVDLGLNDEITEINKYLVEDVNIADKLVDFNKKLFKSTDNPFGQAARKDVASSSDVENRTGSNLVSVGEYKRHYSVGLSSIGTGSFVFNSANYNKWEQGTASLTIPSSGIFLGLKVSATELNENNDHIYWFSRSRLASTVKTHGDSVLSGSTSWSIPWRVVSAYQTGVGYETMAMLNSAAPTYTVDYPFIALNSKSKQISTGTSLKDSLTSVERPILGMCRTSSNRLLCSFVAFKETLGGTGNFVTSGTATIQRKEFENSTSNNQTTITLELFSII